MPLSAQTVIEAIEAAPYNMGVRGADWLVALGNISVDFPDGSVVLFDWEGDKSYEVHFLLKCKGAKARDLIHEAFDTMFTQYGAELLFGLVPDHRRDVKVAARWSGAKSAGKRETRNGTCELFVLSSLMFFRGSN